ncbi:AAA family ATPase [Amorphus orientalis]|uniref:RecA-family ATPase n=1 Tax=Amorphus orientalis TaxID=649198 RepID=A0AAE3VSH7_9HYPH|nr:AAA family ATPase [Amorphus orientalis]MDQ0317363.1 RecA-family ATPase [Amorphus orientalis]
MSSIDYDKFDVDHPAFARISPFLTVHSKKGGPEHKYWLVPGWLGQYDIAVAFGASGAGKSVFATDLACRLAAGLDIDGGEGGIRWNVLYIAAERQGQVKRRIDAFCKHHGGGDPFDNLMIYDGPIDLLRPGELRAVVRSACLSLDDTIDLVVIDTLAAAMSGSDSNPEAMARAVHALNDAARWGNPDVPCTVLVVHHSGASDEKRMRGATQLHAAADTVIQIARKGDTSTARVVKNNESEARPDRSYKMETVSLGESARGIDTTAPVLVAVEPGRQGEPAASKVPRATLAAAAVLQRAIEANGGPVTEEQWRAAVYADAGDLSEAGKRQRFARARRLQEDGTVTETNGLYALAA